MKKSNLLFVIVSLFIAILFGSFKYDNPKNYYVDYVTQNTKSCVCTTFDTIYFQAKVPRDEFINNQTVANCFAWKEFIALNWPADGSDNFGTPNDKSPVAWETYMTKEVLMPANGQAPPAWGSTHNLLNASTKHKRVLKHASKFTNFMDTITVVETGQAAPQSGPSWLGAHNNTNLWYEVLVNKDEYDYITDPAHQFYNADKQLQWAQKGNPIHLPKGSLNSDVVGAMEIKAAWMEVLATTAIDKGRYKMAEATIIDPINGQQRDAEVALIGLHIIHKTELQPTWIWATFEHVDNVPDNLKSVSGTYNLFNTVCTDRIIQVPAAYSPTKRDTTVTIKCDKYNVSPPYKLGLGGPAPAQLQVTRETPIDPNSADVNTTVQKAIAKQYPNSVFQYYQLVDVIWSSNPTQDKDQPKTGKLTLTGMNPSNYVANTSMETYLQQSKCIDCHQFGTIAGKSNFNSDFSFVLEAASSALGEH